MKDIMIKGLRQNNLKDISITIPKEKIVVFTGLSGSGKSSIVFDTIAAESQRQMNGTYPAFVRSRMPKYVRPQADIIENLTPSVIVDQSSLGGNSRSTVGTISELYGLLRLLFSRIGSPYAGPSSYFSFNNPNGMCPLCGGIGKETAIDIEQLLDKEKSWNEGCIKDTLYRKGSWFWKKYAELGLFNLDKPLKNYTKEEYNLLMYGSREKKGPQEDKNVEGIINRYIRTFLKRDISGLSKATQERARMLIKEKECSMCHGKRLNKAALSCRINGYSIADMCEMEIDELYHVLKDIKDKRAETLVGSLCDGLKRMIDIGLPYLSLNRDTLSLSGGEAQRIKIVRYMGSSLSGMTYIFDEPSTGLHPQDVHRMNNLLMQLRDDGNTVLVVEHDPDVIKIADEIVDVGPYAGKNGGRIVYHGSYKGLLEADTLTSKALKGKIGVNKSPRRIKKTLPIRGASLYNLKNVDIDIPLGVMTVVTGVAGSGKSTLITRVFAKEYSDDVIMVNQGPITATNRSTPASYLGFFDNIRKLFAKENGVCESMFSFNSEGGCPECKGKGVTVTELAYMDPVVNECEFCKGKRYSDEALSYKYRGKNILEVLNLTVDEALEFLDEPKIVRSLKKMKEAGLSYMTLGQPLSTLSGGERQRIKLAKHIGKKGSIFILDEPTTGLHRSDTEKLLKLFNDMVDKGNTVIIIEHDLDIAKQADWIIDIGPGGGKNGGRVVFSGTPYDMVKNSDTVTAEWMRKDC